LLPVTVLSDKKVPLDELAKLAKKHRALELRFFSVFFPAKMRTGSEPLRHVNLVGGDWNIGLIWFNMV
jgi:hypothetical protein